MRTMSRWAVPVLVAVCSAASWGQSPVARDAGIYVCTDDDGKPITRDRYILECRHKEQRILNRDGSLRTRVPPTLTADEHARAEAAERDRRERDEAKKDAVKFDQLLLRRFPDEAAHKRARDKALEPSRAAIQSAEARLRDFAVERKKLNDEVEFYRGRVVPVSLKQQIEGNEAQADAQRTSIKNGQAEQARIHKLFDSELDRLRKLWKGAMPGSLGPPPQ